MPLRHHPRLRDAARPRAVRIGRRHGLGSVPSSIRLAALLLLAACSGGADDHTHAAPAESGGAPVTLAASGEDRTGNLIPAAPIPNGTVGIGVAYDPSEAGMLSVSRGVALAVRDLNARGGALRFAARTSAPGITSAVQSATELRSDPRVVGVVGHTESGASLDAIPVYEDLEHAGEHAVVAVSPTATSPRLSGHSRWFFRVCPNDLAASRAVAHYALDSLRARRAAIVYRNDSYGRDWTAEFVKVFTEGGGEIVQRDPYLRGVTEWEAYAGYMRLRGADVFLLPGSVEDAEEAIQAVRRTGADIPFIGGDAASALTAKAEEYAGARYTAFFDPRAEATERTRAFVEAFVESFGVLPDQRAALAYDAAILIGEAALAVGPDRHRIRDWIERVGSDLPPVIGVAGPIAFDERHDPKDRQVIVARVEAP